MPVKPPPPPPPPPPPDHPDTRIADIVMASIIGLLLLAIGIGTVGLVVTFVIDVAF